MIIDGEKCWWLDQIDGKLVDYSIFIRLSIIYIMGNNIVLRNPLFEDWKPIANDPDIYINSKTKKQVRSCVVLLDERD